MPPRRPNNNRERTETRDTEHEPSILNSRSTTPGPVEPEEEVPAFFDSIDELQTHGINAQDITKLKLAGLYTVSSVRMMTKRHLMKLKGLSDTKVDKIKEAAAKLSGSSFCTGTELSNRREKVMHISTGSKSVDLILGGGFETQSISEGTEVLKVAYIDTEGMKLLQDQYAKVPMLAQMELIQDLACRFAEEKMYSLLVSRSNWLQEWTTLMSYRTDYTGRAELSERQQKVGVSLVPSQTILNDFLSWVRSPSSLQIKCSVMYRVQLGMSSLTWPNPAGRAEERIAKLVDSPDMPESDATYKLDEGGWTDV
ncbi:DNA repair and recombination, RecA-like protein [Calocera cornea HHB12733]|uniref:DNA repair and recombination, RecA-like protein n=1 Tax=Calocera cornea HHB12733 TaxID=1353952 RepID=A0A165GLQ0_9BASI|nr:DNA repair and recombination, RecA-like protein [Calocera cornea HHB12733]